MDKITIHTVRDELLCHMHDVARDLYDEDETNFEDLHEKCFNQDYYIIGYYQASQWLKKHNICAFEAIETVANWEKEHCGEFTTDINSEAIVNMYVYIKGEEILNSLDIDIHDCTKDELLTALKGE